MWKSVCRTEQKDCRKAVKRTPEIHTSAPNRKVSSSKTQYQHGLLQGFSGTFILHRTPEYVDRLVKEATEIRLNKNNFNRNRDFILSHAWSPITSMLMNVKAGPSRAVTWICPPLRPGSCLKKNYFS